MSRIEDTLRSDEWTRKEELLREDAVAASKVEAKQSAAKKLFKGPKGNLVTECKKAQSENSPLLGGHVRPYPGAPGQQTDGL